MTTPKIGVADVYSNTDDYKRGYREGFQDGFEAARKQSYPVSPTLPHIQSNALICKVCGIDFSGKVWGYVCYHERCPTKVTSAV